MATTHTKTTTPQIEDALGQFLAATRKAGNLYVDSYENAVDRALELELQAAGLTQQEWLKKLMEAQAGFTRELAASYTSAARSLLK